MGQERLGPSYFFIPLVLGLLNSLVWYVPSLRYTRCLGWRMHCGAEVTESSTNKQHHLSMDKEQWQLPYGLVSRPSGRRCHGFLHGTMEGLTEPRKSSTGQPYKIPRLMAAQDG